jgi:hypothetical protein
MRSSAGRVPLFLLLGLLLWGTAWAEPLPPLTAPGHPGWKEKVFAGRTVYTALPGEGLLLAESRGAASGLFLERRIDLRSTPWLHWSWKVADTFSGLNEREKSGDDYPARIYVVAKGGLAFWKTRALSYVWASGEPQDSMWPSAFTGNAVMIAVRSGPGRAGELVAEKRDVRADWKRAFGDDIEAIDGVAIMTDTDNAGRTARAWYGQPRFSAE